MIKLKISLIPNKQVPLSLNYRHYLGNICDELMDECQENILGKRKKNNREKDELLLTYSPFYSSECEIKQNKIIFNGTVIWYISSPSYELILSLIQKLFRRGNLKVGIEEFEISGLEISESVALNNESLETISLIAASEEINKEYIVKDYLLAEEFENII